MRPYLENTHQKKKRLAEWLKVKVLSLSSSIAKKKKEKSNEEPLKSFYEDAIHILYESPIYKRKIQQLLVYSQNCATTAPLKNFHTY
jgi:hypothetical protein